MNPPQAWAERVAAAKVLYSRRCGSDLNTDDHFAWYFRYAGDPMSSVHVSTVRAALDDADALFASGLISRKPSEEEAISVLCKAKFNGKFTLGDAQDLARAVLGAKREGE